MKLAIAIKRFAVYFLLLSVSSCCHAQGGKDNSIVYIDKNGVMRWRNNDKEAAFFGVNYTTPFAHAYRAHKALSVDLEKAIQQDVYHMARLGFDAFRVHVWDTEISDVSGNLLNNDHLRLFDFLLAELKKRNIKTIITPIAFWGNGYPEPDEATPGFSRFYGRSKLTTNDSAIVAQENYLKQFFNHVNPYTKLTYQNDPDVIAVEINNEPSHSNPKKDVTQYINRLADAVKKTGWSKPVFYNISQGPYFADAVAASSVVGFSFQWYPAGLVSGGSLKGNYLPHVDTYAIPFDTIPAFAKKALMVYEFDAADIFESYIYPAMARSFRTAGFQWATQFAYDPMAIAHVNTEYQTHYLNLAYTPSKAISMLIASKVFHQVARLKSFGSYPADSTFDKFRVSYEQLLSEMNSEKEFYYSNSTGTRPLNAPTLEHIAGVGNSPVVTYAGLGAYFLDKVEEGVWRLEVMPDAIHIRDPFERASPKKEVTRIQWQTHSMKVNLTDLGIEFGIEALNSGNTWSATCKATEFQIRPGTYLLVRKNKKPSANKKQIGPIQLNEFVAPQSVSGEMYLRHDPVTEVSAGKPFAVQAKVVGMDSGSVTLLINQLGGQFKRIPMVRKTKYDYVAEVPADLVAPGILNYRIVLQQGNDFSVFPGNIKGNPFAWDTYQNETWKTLVASENADLEIYNPTTDRTARIYPGFRRNFRTSYITGEKPGQLILRLAATELSGDHTIGFQHSFAGKLGARIAEANAFDKLVIRARTNNDQPVKAKVVLINSLGDAVTTLINLTPGFQDIEIPLASLKPGAGLLLPRPYPGFQPMSFSPGRKSASFTIAEAERIEITIGSDVNPDEFKKPYGLEVEGIWLKKKN